MAASSCSCFKASRIISTFSLICRPSAPSKALAMTSSISLTTASLVPVIPTPRLAGLSAMPWRTWSQLFRLISAVCAHLEELEAELRGTGRDECCVDWLIR